MWLPHEKSKLWLLFGGYQNNFSNYLRNMWTFSINLPLNVIKIIG